MEGDVVCSHIECTLYFVLCINIITNTLYTRIQVPNSSSSARQYDRRWVHSDWAVLSLHICHAQPLCHHVNIRPIHFLAAPRKIYQYPVQKLFLKVESVDPVAVATGMFCLDLGLGEGFEGEGEEFPLCRRLWCRPRHVKQLWVLSQSRSWCPRTKQFSSSYIPTARRPSSGEIVRMCGQEGASA